MRQGEVRWFRFAPPDKRRPVVVLTRSSAIPRLGRVTVAPVTTTIRGIPSEAPLGRDDGLFAECAANLDNIHTVDKAELGELIAVLSPERMRTVRSAIEFALGFRSMG